MAGPTSHDPVELVPVPFYRQGSRGSADEGLPKDTQLAQGVWGRPGACASAAASISSFPVVFPYTRVTASSGWFTG